MISDEHLDLILESAMRAPTAGSMMMYSILVIKDKEKIKKLAKRAVMISLLSPMHQWYLYF